VNAPKVFTEWRSMLADSMEKAGVPEAVVEFVADIGLEGGQGFSELWNVWLHIEDGMRLAAEDGVELTSPEWQEHAYAATVEIMLAFRFIETYEVAGRCRRFFAEALDADKDYLRTNQLGDRGTL
jgi:hypothetical protein